jgi:L-rhamnose mutarotase
MMNDAGQDSSFIIHNSSLNMRFCLALDLKPDPALIAEYEAYHRAVWPEILESIRSAGISALEIYRVENRLFMILEAGDGFSFEQKAGMDAANPKVQEWETLMWRYHRHYRRPGRGEVGVDGADISIAGWREPLLIIEDCW